MLPHNTKPVIWSMNMQPLQSRQIFFYWESLNILSCESNSRISRPQRVSWCDCHTFISKYSQQINFETLTNQSLAAIEHSGPFYCESQNIFCKLSVTRYYASRQVSDWSYRKPPSNFRLFAVFHVSCKPSLKWHLRSSRETVQVFSGGGRAKTWSVFHSHSCLDWIFSC